MITAIANREDTQNIEQESKSQQPTNDTPSQPFLNRFQHPHQNQVHDHQPPPPTGARQEMNPMVTYIKSLTSAVKHQTTNSKGHRKTRYAPARSPYEVGFHPSFNENVRGVPPTTLHITKLF